MLIDIGVADFVLRSSIYFNCSGRHRPGLVFSVIFEEVGI
jgi:hypothetical protein